MAESRPAKLTLDFAGTNSTIGKQTEEEVMAGARKPRAPEGAAGRHCVCGNRLSIQGVSYSYAVVWLASGWGTRRRLGIPGGVYDIEWNGSSNAATLCNYCWFETDRARTIL